ncbi:3-hydroxyacyl-CoA dehydrogenase NAD-binding domain-containing protein [Streptomyces bobili]
MSTLRNLTVLGSGVLGGQIAWHSAFQGKTVVVYDIAVDALARCRLAHEQYAALYVSNLGAGEADVVATRDRLTFATDLAGAVAGADLLPPHALVATNSSTLLPRDFAADTGRPEKFCALHFANEIWSMNVAELMAHPGASRDTLTAVAEFAVEIRMVPIPVMKEQKGYILNSWFVPLVNAAQSLVTNGVATAEDVDRTFMIGGRPIGPMGLLDMVGMKTAFDVLHYWGTQTGDPQMGANAAYIKEHFLDKGRLGLATGKGYYEYPDPAYLRPGFLDVPDIAAVPDIVSRMLPL